MSDDKARMDDYAEIRRLRDKLQDLESKWNDVWAGCDIQKGDKIYRQVPVVIGPGKTQPELDLEKATAALTKINDIRNSIVGFQTVNFSEHVYPLVVALKEAGFEGLPYPEARAQVETLMGERDKLLDAIKKIGFSVLKASNGWTLQGVREYDKQNEEADLERVHKLIELEMELDLHRQKAKGEYWAWQDDGEDHLESLTCPVLIGAGQLRRILDENDRLKKGPARG